ncbi:hypothetical protein A2379_02825 [Candidatus Amesbacteria bacterium RIFOXYB1_FULL_47_13]|nr:MAG: hypothetical protein A2379_02825 [Candidatus Amesbacteria bacterium RIFOXYB1_FULL_47_13]HBC72234.1 hypothetical protein [Candidatus Amesbacteria bacterium]
MEPRWYHIYNRGIDGRQVFTSSGDYDKFIWVLKTYLGEFKIKQDPRFKTDRPYISRHKQRMNLHDKVCLAAYCLMPNHFHLLVQPESAGRVTYLMRRAMTNYGMYFNQKYQRRGTLWEGSYRCVEVWGEERIVHLSRWIHLNPLQQEIRRFGLVTTVTGARPEEYLYSSYHWYLHTGEIDDWIRPDLVLDIFKGFNQGRWGSYQQFIEDSRLNTVSIIGSMAIDTGREKIS